jgi:hypothetical protein
MCQNPESRDLNLYRREIVKPRIPLLLCFSSACNPAPVTQVEQIPMKADLQSILTVRMLFLRL